MSTLSFLERSILLHVPSFLGQNLIGLNKRDGGIRPIAVGCTLRRLAAKCVNASIFEDMGSLLFPLQLGFGTPKGAEAAVHAARSFLSGMEEGHLMLKLDFKNAFNSIRRDKMLYAVLEKAPQIFPLAFAAYQLPSFLFFGNHIIHSAEGVQQGDPLGPLLFCLTIHDLIGELKSEFKVFYLDDGTLGGTLDDVQSDLLHLERVASEFNLFLNHSKSEIICNDEQSKLEMLSRFPSLHPTVPSRAILLGSPIGGTEAINEVWESKIKQLKTLGSRLELLHSHDALCLLRSAFSLPKVLYILRTSPSFLSPLLANFDNVQRCLLESICNIRLSDQSWLQASLPINSGGLGIRSATMLAPFAFLASAAGTSSISLALLPPRLTSELATCTFQAEALRLWNSYHPGDPPLGSSAGSQKAWVTPIVDAAVHSLTSSADSTSRARLLAAQQKESGAWLSAPPISSLGLRLDDDCVRVAVGLRLGCSLCLPHDCPLCGVRVEESGLHGLSCRRSQGRLPRHSALNDIVKRALSAVNIPATLEPRGLCRSDGKRPDGVSIIPWSDGRCLVWDVTCHDTFAHSNIHLASSGTGLVADRAASLKRQVYAELQIKYIFIPIAVESSGSFGRDALSFFHDLSMRTRQITKDPLSYLKLCQQISACIQRFNTSSILGCCTG